MLQSFARVLIVTMALVWTLYPLMWIVLSSFKPASEQFMIPPRWTPSQWSLENYARFFSNAEFVRSLLNSMVVTATAVGISLLVGVPAAYGLSRFTFRGKHQVTVGVLLARMTPPIVLVLPVFLIARRLGVIGTYFVLITVMAVFAIPFAVWMLRGFFAEIPKELEEAAMVDGCSRLAAIARVTLPLTAPGMAATSVLNSLIVWNEFLFILVLSSPATRTLTVLVNTFVSEKVVDWGTMSAAAVITALPLVIVGLASQRHLVRGLTMGSIK
ncbi:sugar ABC transporter permease [Limnochorda pilosa]|uniref:Sugar ABC transporter permease n=2 Tax=Limnochorda pilosa TaxID=1555112 RepID=A0A0K2SGM4_LIMPI|nr:sugar ABC transporter permease [Limnochorda pilosa]